MMGPKRNWKDARAKVELEGACRVCKTELCLEAAHVTGRRHDRPKPGKKELWVDPVSVVPLCGPFPEGCHGAYDRHEISILSVLETDEQVRAVEDLGSIDSALHRVAPGAAA
jgi:hypothetical protein